MNRAILDSSLIAWDKHKFYQNTNFYYELMEQVTYILDFIEKHNCKIYMSVEVRDILINHFPCDALTRKFPHLWDFVNLVFRFLSNNFDSFDDPCLKEDHYVYITQEPIYFDVNEEERQRLYNMFFCAVTNGIKFMISCSLIWPNDNCLTINNNDIIAIIKNEKEWID